MANPTDIIQRVQHFLNDGLWRSDIANMPWPQRVCYRTARLVMALVEDLSSGELTLRAMSLVYTTLLSLVPLLAVSFSVLKAFGVHNQVEPLLINLMMPLGDKGQELAHNMLGFVENMKVGVLGAVGLALLLYTVVSLIQKVENAFNHVWHTKSSRSLSRRFSDYLSVIMVGPVLVFSAMGITATLMNTTLVANLLSIEPFGTLIVLMTKLVPFLLVLLAFTFLYMFVPNTQVKLSSALFGALIGGTLWQLSGLVFAEFASSSTRYDAVYSGFAILILAMIWLYLSWLILLAGAQIAYYHQHPAQLRPGSVRAPLSGQLREQLGLLVMYRIAEQFVGHHPPLSQEALSEQLHMPADRIGEMLTILEGCGLLLETSEEPPQFVLACDPASLTLADLLSRLRSAQHDQALLASQLHSAAAINTLIDDLNSAIRRQLAGLTLSELVSPAGPADPSLPQQG